MRIVLLKLHHIINIVKNKLHSIKKEEVRLNYISALIGGMIMGISGGIYGIKVIPIFIVQLLICIIVHELAHGLVAHKSGLKFSVLYVGPIVFILDNLKIKKIKMNRLQLMYLGRAQIDNNEIIKDSDFEKHVNMWKKALIAGPISDLILATIFIFISIILKKYIFIYTTLSIIFIISIPSYLMGDGKHVKLLKKDNLFSELLMYTYSIVGNTEVSNKSKKYLVSRLFKSIETCNPNKQNIINISAILCVLYQAYIIEEINSLPKNNEEIMNKVIEYKKIILKEKIEQSYFKSVVSNYIIYNIMYLDKTDKVLDLYEQIKSLKFNNLGEKLDLFRIEHILEIKNRKIELESDKYMNPLFIGCEGVYEIENKVNKKIIDFIDKKKACN